MLDKRECVDAEEGSGLCRPASCQHLKTAQLLRVGGHKEEIGAGGEGEGRGVAEQEVGQRERHGTRQDGYGG